MYHLGMQYVHSPPANAVWRVSPHLQSTLLSCPRRHGLWGDATSRKWWAWWRLERWHPACLGTTSSFGQLCSLLNLALCQAWFRLKWENVTVLSYPWFGVVSVLVFFCLFGFGGGGDLVWVFFLMGTFNSYWYFSFRQDSQRTRGEPRWSRLHSTLIRLDSISFTQATTPRTRNYMSFPTLPSCYNQW